jgi:hypothetical protein
LKLALPCGQTLQCGDHGIEGTLDAIHAVEKRLGIKFSLSFEMADPVPSTPPGDTEADGTDPEALSRHKQRAEKKARRIHSSLPFARCLAASRIALLLRGAAASAPATNLRVLATGPGSGSAG